MTAPAGFSRSSYDTLAASTDDFLKNKQLESCPSQSPMSLIIVGCQERNVPTYYTIEANVVRNGATFTRRDRFRYSQLLELNEALIREWGAIRVLRLFPPKKVVGNREGNFVKQRQSGIQNWLNELNAEEEICDEPALREFFGLTNLEDIIPG
jgi:hypothetical protein